MTAEIQNQDIFRIYITKIVSFMRELMIMIQFLDGLTVISKEDAEYAKKYMRLSEAEGYHWGMMRTAWACIADTAIMQMQDILGLGKSARMNTPSTLSDKNWKLEMSAGSVQ